MRRFGLFLLALSVLTLPQLAFLTVCSPGATVTMAWNNTTSKLLITVNGPVGVGGAQLVMDIPSELTVGSATFTGFMTGATHLSSGTEHRWFQLQANGQQIGTVEIPITIPLGGGEYTITLASVGLKDMTGNTISIDTPLPISIQVPGEKGTTRIELDASPRPGYVNKPVTISGVLYGSWRCIRDGMVVGKPVSITTGWGFSTVLTTDYYGHFSVTTSCPSTGGTYTVTATFYEDEDLTGTSTTIQYEVIAKIPTTMTISYVGNREFGGYLRRADTGAYLAYKPVKLTVHYLSGTTWQTATFDLQTRQDGYYSLEFLFYWNSATAMFEGDETYASSSATLTR